MIKFNLNPKGIKTGDCVIRAISYALNKSWDDVYNDLCKIGLKLKRMPNEPQVYQKYLESLNWIKQKQPRYEECTYGYQTSFKKVTLSEFIDKLNRDAEAGKEQRGNNFIISVANHLTCVSKITDTHKYDLVDTWDCSYKCVGNYWIKPL